MFAVYLLPEKPANVVLTFLGGGGIGERGEGGRRVGGEGRGGRMEGGGFHASILP